MRERTQVSGIQNTGAKFSCLKVCSSTLQRERTQQPLLETCSWLDAAQNFLISSETSTGMSFFVVVRPCVFWVSKQMHLEGLKCARSKIEIWEAVLELKRGRVFRDYSNENLSEAYKNSVLSIIFNWYLMATFPGKDRLRAVICRSKTSQLLKVGPPRGERHTLLWSLEFFFAFFFFFLKK